MQGLLVTGTDTEVGKTWVTALIARELRSQGISVGVYKPVCSGAETTSDGVRWPDIDALSAAVNHEFPDDRICPQRFRAPLAPPVAAREEGATIDSEMLATGIDWWRDRVDYLLIEGVGGLLCPLTDSTDVADLAVRLKFPLLVVARVGLGTLNHTLLTLEAAAHRGLPVNGVVLNAITHAAEDVSIASNPGELAKRTSVPVLGVCQSGATRLREVPPTGTMDPSLQNGDAFVSAITLRDLFEPNR